MTLETSIAQLETDIALAHNWAHGDGTAVITTDGGPVRSPAKLIADLEAQIVSDAASYLALCIAEKVLADGFAADAAVSAALSATFDGATHVNAINRALNERPFEAPPLPADTANLVSAALPYFDRKLNIQTSSEDPSQAHYAKDTITIVAGDTRKWNGITLTRFTNVTPFTCGLRDIRASDYPLTAGKRYIVSAVAAAPFLKADANAIPGPWNQFCWMRMPADANDHGHGSKLIGPMPRRIFTLAEASSGTDWRVVSNPATALSATAGASNAMRFFANCYGLGGTLAIGDIYLGGFQVEEAPNQTEKPGIALIGTSIDSTTSSLKHPTQDRAWPRWLEGLLDRPIYNGAIGGQNSTQLEARFNTDIAPWGVNAKYCLMCANVNDFATGFSSATYRANWLSMYNKAIAAGMTPIFVTPARRTTYDYVGGPADMEAEIAYIKATYPKVIDRDLVLQDAFSPNLLNRVYDADGIHFNATGARAFAFAVYHKFRHLFAFDNIPGPYQGTVRDDPGTASADVQQFGTPMWLSRYAGSRLDAAAAATQYRGDHAATAPVLVFYGTAGSWKAFQLPCPMFGDARAASRLNTDIRRQLIVNATGDGFNVSVRYYGYNGSGALVAIGPQIDIPPGKAYEVMTDGTTAWRVE